MADPYSLEPFRLVDTHAHIYCQEFDEDRAEMMLRAQEVGVTTFIVPNVDLESLPRMLSVHQTYPDCTHLAIGLHPTSIDQDYRWQLEKLYSVLSEQEGRGVVAIGEIGLDFYWDSTYRTEQEKALVEQLNWAIRFDLPVILHIRQAYDEALSLLANFSSKSRLRGVFHCFEGNAEQMEQILSDLPQMMLGINGNVTYKKSLLPPLLSQMPRDRILLETDAPYLSPIPMRGKRNEPAHLIHTARFVAESMSLSVEELARITTHNATNLFAIPH